MYPAPFGLRGDAFGLSPDPGLLYLSPIHAEALAALRLGVENHRGIMVMTGEVGTGKTLLLHALLYDAEARFHTAYVSNTKLSFDDVLRQALDDFGAPYQERDRLALLDAFNAFLRRSTSAGSTVILVVDEAQNLSDDTLENIRLLSNYETYGGKLLQIILAGQPELEARLRAPHLRQLNERVAVRCHLQPLRSKEVRRYVEHRLAQAGGSLDLFTPGALRLIIREARGIPRRVNLLCYGALMFANANHAQRVDARAVRAAIRERRGRAITEPEAGHHMGGMWVWFLPQRLVALAMFVVLVALSGWAGILVGLRTNGTPGANVLGTAAEHVSRLAPIPGADASSPAPALATTSDTSNKVGSVSRTETTNDSAAVDAAQAGAMASVESGPDTASDSAGTAHVKPTPHPSYDLVRVPAGVTLRALARNAYGSDAPQILARIQQANPKIVDLDRIYAGEVLRFPK